MPDVDWSTEQTKVINSPGSSRILVDAGPGTGKTAVACMRIANLINEGFCSPHEIIVISFTNTAVYEIRERIKGYLRESSSATNIRVTTLDSFAGKLRAGFDSIDTAQTSFDENITKASKLIFTDPDVAEFISTIRHLVVDEAQDVVGERSLFILEMVSKMENTSGITVLCDEAQAIYGFTNDNPLDELSTDTLPESIRKFNKHFENPFEFLQLKEVFRTENSKMQKLFLEGREILKDSKLAPSIVYENLRALILETSDIELPTAKELLEQNEDDPEEWQQDWTDIFLIFRKRGEALQASTHLSNQPRRIRLSGLPVPLKPWLADVFWNYEDDEISESEFQRRFESSAANKGYELNAEEAWGLLMSESGISSKKISVRTLRTKLSRYSPNPDFTYSDFGVGGPIFSSIHASKGRESNGVLLFLPKQHIRTEATPEEIVEEAKVLFVGATRAKEEVLVYNGEDYTPISALKSSGRAYSYLSKKNFSVSVEIGRKEDLSPFSLVGEKLFDDYADVANGQRFFRNNPFNVVEMTVFGSGKEKNYQYSVLRKQSNKTKQSLERTLFYLDQRVNQDFWSLANFMSNRTKPPTFFSPIYSLGVRSMVLPAGDPRLDDLHEPWKSSGFIHAPMISGYPYMRFDRKGS
jgi:superfamily I DNA/RNA helicase